MSDDQAIKPGDIMISGQGTRWEQKYRMIEPLMLGDDPQYGPEFCCSEEHDEVPVAMWRVQCLGDRKIRPMCPDGLKHVGGEG